MKYSVILVAALPVLAHSFSLASVEELPSGLGGACAGAYETEIKQCTALDLKNECSEGCLKALKTASTDIILGCRQATIPSEATVLKAAMKGGDALAEAICGSGSGSDDEQEETKTTKAPNTTKTSAPTLPPTSTPTSDSSSGSDLEVDENAAVELPQETSTPSTGKPGSGSENSSGGGDPFSASEDDDSESAAFKTGSSTMALAVSVAAAMFFGSNMW